VTVRLARGFTLIELAIALAVMGVLVTMAAPVLRLQAQRTQEAELRQALREIRGALDAYRRAVQEGRVKLPADASGYPASLDLLVDGVPDASRADGRRIYFLRRLPRDPMHNGSGVSAARTWATRSYASPPEQPAAGADVFDVRSMSERTGLNGVPYREW
jgi:general secretion pathway protein G